MSHEIYYTSAPEGIKRGTSGFSTVAASENIPKALWDRLETLSAYRHQFGPGGQPNPISYAHWILAIAGKSHHVLSRICDSGVDHTQRTNAFAHHLALEPAEIAGAVGGPAWLLEQPGVMMERWDGQVGSLLPPSPGRLAKGDIFSSSRVCRAWEAMTGDAGWGGHLADVFAKSPTRPVCILFGPGQELLPLLAESIALLPPAARWNVTFNTYFTSMPTSATCLWRCCLAGTPAAQTGLRYAANGLMLDLTDRSRLPALPGGDYVTMARTGQSSAAARPAASAARPAQPTLAELKSKAPPKGRTGAPAPVFDPFAEETRRESDLRRQLLDDFDRLVDETVPDQSGTPDMDSASSGSGTYDRRGAEAPADTAPLRRPRGQGTPPPPRMIRRAEEALEDAEREAVRAAQRRRQQVMMLFVGALGAIAVGSALVYFVNRNSAPPEISTPTTVRSRPVDSVPVFGKTDTPPVTTELATRQATDTGPAVVQSQPGKATTQAVIPAVTYPEFLTLSSAIERPNVGTGIGDRPQSLSLKAADLDPMPITAVGLTFFYNQTGTPAAPASTNIPTYYKNDTLGTLTAASGAVGAKKGVAILWKPASDPGLGTEMLFIALDRSKPGLELNWHAAALLRNPAAYNYIFWALQNSALSLESGRATRQQIVMKPVAQAPINFADAGMDLTWPADFPHDVRVVEPPVEALPPGWKADWYLDWDTAMPAAARTTENANQVISFKKATGNTKIEPWFLLTFKPAANGGGGGGIAKVECTFAKRFQQDQDDLARADKDLADITRKITDLKNDPANTAFNGGRIPDELMTKQNEAQATAEAYKAAVAGYNELTQFDVSIDLSDKMRLATLHFQRPKALDAGK